jgi:hypothetical protein
MSLILYILVKGGCERKNIRMEIEIEVIFLLSGVMYI